MNSYILLWTPSHGPAKVRWSARIYIQQLALKTYQERQMIEKGGVRGSGRSMLAAWHYDDCIEFVNILALYIFPIYLRQCFILIAVFTAALICEIKCFQTYLGSLVSSLTNTKSFGATAFTISRTIHSNISHLLTHS